MTCRHLCVSTLAKIGFYCINPEYLVKNAINHVNDMQNNHGKILIGSQTILQPPRLSLISVVTLEDFGRRI